VAYTLGWTGMTPKVDPMIEIDRSMLCFGMRDKKSGFFEMRVSL